MRTRSTPQPDPYRDFQNDDLRLEGLKHRERWRSITKIVIAIASPFSAIAAAMLFTWLKS